MPIRQSLLIEKSASYRKDFSESVQNQKKASGLTYQTAFLCHSHHDEKMVLGLLNYFEELGINLYIDWKDHTMPESPNQETARKIQNKIKSNDVFLFLATANAKASRWCPWEIGYADSCPKNIYIIPTSDSLSEYGNEYLSLYPKIDIGTAQSREGLAIFHPGKTSGSWLSSTSI